MTAKFRAIHATDKAFAAYIRARDPACVTCGAPTTDCSHFFRRGHHATRWDENNAAGQCRRCHFIHHHQSESYLLDYARKKLKAGGRYAELRDRWDGVSQWKTYQLEEVARFYQDKLARLRDHV